MACAIRLTNTGTAYPWYLTLADTREAEDSQLCPAARHAMESGRREN